MQRRYIIVVLGALALLLSIPRLAQADLFTYNINAATGEGGSTLTGTITFTGNPGDPATIDTSFDDVASFDIFWNYAPGESIEWNPSDVDPNSYSTGLYFDNTLGAPVLNPVSGYIYLETIDEFFTPVELDLGYDGFESGWEVSAYSEALLDFGSPLSLDLGPVIAATPLPSTFSMALAGLPALALWRWVKSRRQSA